MCVYIYVCIYVRMHIYIYIYMYIYIYIYMYTYCEDRTAYGCVQAFGFGTNASVMRLARPGSVQVFVFVVSLYLFFLNA